MNRRSFLRLGAGAAGGLVATATMAEAGMLAEFLDWLKRKPVTTIGKPLKAGYVQAFHSDGFAIGDFITIGGGSPHGGTYHITSVSHRGMIGKAVPISYWNGTVSPVGQ